MSGTPNATATGAESSPLLGKGKKDGSTRWVRDLTIAVVSLALIVATFFITIELMNYEYKRTTFEVYTGCIDDTTKAKLLAQGFDLDSEQIHAVYVVPSGSAPVKMAHDDTRVGVYTVSTWMSNNKWSFAVAGAHEPETPAVLFSEAGNRTVSPLATPHHKRCAAETSEGSGVFTRELSEDAVTDGGFVSHVFGSCHYSCDSEFAPVADGPVDEMTGDDVSFISSDADPTRPAATQERFHSAPIYPGAPDTTAYLDAPMDAEGFMVLPDGISSGVVVREGGDMQLFTENRVHGVHESHSDVP